MKINRVLKNKGLKARGYKKNGKVTIVDTTEGKYIYK